MNFFPVKTAVIALCAVMSMTLSVNNFTYERNYLSSTWLKTQINKHPDIVAASESMNAVFSRTQSCKLPLYNPELITGDYLLALQQRVTGLYAGIDLHTQFKLSEVAWLLSVGQISSATMQLS